MTKEERGMAVEVTELLTVKADRALVDSCKADAELAAAKAAYKNWTASEAACNSLGEGFADQQYIAAIDKARKNAERMASQAAHNRKVADFAVRVFLSA